MRNNDHDYDNDSTAKVGVNINEFTVSTNTARHGDKEMSCKNLGYVTK